MKIVTIVACAVMCLSAPGAEAGELESYLSKYPSSKYYIGRGEVMRSASDLRDKRVAEVMARRELALQIRSRVSEATTDVLCSNGGVFSKRDACEEAFASLVEVTANEFMQGAEIIDSGIDGGSYYAVAVMPKKPADLETELAKLEDSIKQAQYYIKGAAGNAETLQLARFYYMNSRSLESQIRLLGGDTGKYASIINGLEKDLGELK